MKIALIQRKVSHDHGSNISDGIDCMRIAAEAGAALVAFPELSFTPFYPQYKATSLSTALAEPVSGNTVRQIAEAARDLGIVTVINIFEQDAAQTFDTSVVIDENGDIVGKNRMLHITEYDCFHEQGYYAPGDTYAPVFETSVGRIGVCICYDRHFPEYMRSLALQEADLVIIPQAGAKNEWPGDMYTAEVRVASFQNGFYCAMANRVGREGNLEFAGESVVTDPWGSIVAQAPSGEDSILFAEIDLARCSDAPARRLFLGDRRPEIYAGGAVAIPGIDEG